MTTPEAVEEQPDMMGVDPVLVTLLCALPGRDDAIGDSPAGLSLARLAKRTGLRQSTLRRNLTRLEDAGLVRVKLDEAGGGRVLLTEAGDELTNAIREAG